MQRSGQIGEVIDAWVCAAAFPVGDAVCGAAIGGDGMAEEVAELALCHAGIAAEASDAGADGLGG